MRRGFISILTAALLFGATCDRAQQSTPNSPSSQQQGVPPSPPPPPEAPPSRQDQGKITQVVNLVDVLFTVLARPNKLAPTLEKEDFRISDDKAPQTIRYFSKQTDLPLRIGLLMDTSN